MARSAQMRKHPIPPVRAPEILPVDAPVSSLPSAPEIGEAPPFELVPYGPVEGLDAAPALPRALGLSPAEEASAAVANDQPPVPETEEPRAAVADDEPVVPEVEETPPVQGVARLGAQVEESSINYDDEGLLEIELEEAQYRFDAGKQGTALCLSVRALGTYRWSSLGELKWDGRDLRSKSLERKLLGELSLALREFSQAQAD